MGVLDAGGRGVKKGGIILACSKTPEAHHRAHMITIIAINTQELNELRNHMVALFLIF